MGTSTSKFKKYLQHGDEYAAMQVYQGSAELQRGLNPNHSYGEHHFHNTPLHYAALHGMKHLIRAFLNELGGNPNQRNGRGQTSLHCVCSVTQQKSLSALERRLYSVVFLLSWRGPCLSSGQRERVDVNAKDNYGFTALHYASQSGLKKCVEYLLAHGADPCVENKKGLVPSDLARLKGYHEIAAFLESKMAVEENSANDMSNVSEESRNPSFDRVDCYAGLKSQDLEEAKEQLVNETAEILHVQYLTAETLLKQFEWSKENMLDQWNKDPFSTCKAAGIQLSSLYEQNIAISMSSDQKGVFSRQQKYEPKMIYSENSFLVDEKLGEDELLCDLCCDLIEVGETFKDNHLTCKHNFCSRCWKTYLYKSLPENSFSPITCPLFECNIILPMKVIEDHVSPKTIRKFIRLGTESSLDTDNFAKLCPYPNCQRVVRLNENERLLFYKTAINPPVSHGIDCGGGHFFCWDCGSLESHAPVGCSNWKQWLTRCEELTSTESKAGQGLSWLISNTRLCPRCNYSVQKFDACTLVNCIKCHYDFCWVCLGSWKSHSGASPDGYFQCNRYENFPASIMPMSDTQRTVHKFLHYFIRYKNHLNARSMEKLFLKSAMKKHEILSSLMPTEIEDRKCSTSLEKFFIDVSEKSDNFFEDCVLELVKARSSLCSSYAYGFYLSECDPELESVLRNRLRIFESLQNELEDLTELLSEMISRPQSRSSLRTIINTTQLCKQKRQEFLNSAYRGFHPTIEPQTSGIKLNTTSSKFISAPKSNHLDHKKMVGTVQKEFLFKRQKSTTTDQLWAKVTPSPLRAHQCSRKGCLNVCLSSTSVLSKSKEFCSQNCVMKKSRRNTVENFELLPAFATGARAISSGVNVISSTAKLQNQVLSSNVSTLKSECPPLVPPHQNLQPNPPEPAVRTLSKIGVPVDEKDSVSGSKDLSIFKEEEEECHLSTVQTNLNPMIKKPFEVFKPIILPKLMKERPRLLGRNFSRLRILSEERDLSHQDARALLAKKLNELANNRLDIWEKRQKFVRQKSFDFESDLEPDADASTRLQYLEMLGFRIRYHKLPVSRYTKIKSEMATQTEETIQEITADKRDPDEKPIQPRKRPDLTIKIYKNSIDPGIEPVIEDFKSQSLHISGISINRTPPGAPPPSATASPKYQIFLDASSPTSGTLPLMSIPSRSRSSSLFVPPTTSQSSWISPQSPETHSLHFGNVTSPSKSNLSQVLIPKRSPDMFTFPPSITRKDSNQTLSSVLYIDDRQLTTEDFHEALFFDRSPIKGKSMARKQRKALRQSDETISDENKITFETPPVANDKLGTVKYELQSESYLRFPLDL